MSLGVCRDEYLKGTLSLCLPVASREQVRSWGFNHPDSLPFTQLQARLGPERWKELEEGHHGKEAREFTERKLAELDKYDEMVERMECLQDDVESGKMTIEAFVAVFRESNGFGKA